MTWAAAAFGLAAVGTGLGWMSGRNADRMAKKMIEKQYEADMANWKFNYQEALDQWEFQKEDVDIAQWNFDQQRKLRNAQAANEWIDQDKLRIWDYNNQVKAYNASVESYGVQLEYNDIAAELAASAAAQAYQEELILLGFQHEELTIQHDRKLKATGLKRKDLQLQIDENKRISGYDAQRTKAMLAGKQAELNQKLELQKIDGYGTVGKVRALNQVGRSKRKNLGAVKAASQRLEYALADAMTRSEVNHGLDLAKINAKLEAFGDRIDLQDEMFIEDLYNTRVDTEFTLQQLSESLVSTNLDYQANEQKRSLDKYASDLKAREMLAPAPLLAPEISKPLELPEPVLQKPRKPRKGPEPIAGAAVTGHGLAGLASGLGSMASAAALLAKN